MNVTPRSMDAMNPDESRHPSRSRRRTHSSHAGARTWRGELLDRDDLGETDVRVASQKIRPDLAEGRRDLTVHMCLPPVLALERVEDAIGGVVEFERVPRDRAFLRYGQLTALRKERGKIVAFPRLRFQQRENPSVNGHLPVPSTMSISR